jgi:hypothetical protein
MIRGRTILSEISGRFYESFSSILSARHIREYTASDLAYMLEGQNKEMYRFEKIQVHYSKCLDPVFSHPLLAKGLDRFYPRFRSTLMVEAVRPEDLRLILPGEVEPISGFHPVEEHGADMDGIARILTVPFRWTEGTAQINIPAGQALYQILSLNLVYLVPESLPPAWWTIHLKGRPLTHFSLPPDRMFTTVRIVLPIESAEQGTFSLCLSGPDWKPSTHPVANDYEFSQADQRNLGVVIGWDGFLREELETYEALQEAARRESRSREKYEGFDPNIYWRRLHHCYDDRWSHWQSLYLHQADFKPVLRMGKNDWRQLGPGWYFLENWEGGPVRWTSRRAEAYLSVKRGSQYLRLRVFGGDSRLGSHITGTLGISYSQDRLSFALIAEDPFDLPAGIWTDWVVKFPQKISAPGIIRLVLQTDQSRSPARLIPASADRRELGLGVRGLTIY